MTRVSENSNTHAVNYSIGKAKKHLEDLQMKGSSLLNINRPSDNPIANVEALHLTSSSTDNRQYMRNADFATLQLNTADKVLEQLGEMLLKAKEIALQQSSDFYDDNVRKNVSNEIKQIYNQALAVANTRVGNRYIFAGHSTLNPPFNEFGDYLGDKGHVHLEISKDFFIPANLNGYEIFYNSNSSTKLNESPVKAIRDTLDLKGDKETINSGPLENNRDLASVDTVDTGSNKFTKENNLFGILTNLNTALETNNSKIIHELLEHFDENISRLITLRTRVGSIITSIDMTKDSIHGDNVNNAAQKSKLIDADIAEVFSDIEKQQSVLRTTYQSSNAMMNKTLLDFLR